MRWQRTGSAALIAVGVATSACASASSYLTARPLARGETAVLVAPEAQGGGEAGASSSLMPELALAVRHGVTSRVELGAALAILPAGHIMTSIAGELDGKLALWHSPNERWAVAVGAGLSYRRTTSSGAEWEIASASLPVLVGLRLGDSELVVAPTLGYQRWYSAGAGDVDIPSIGAALGIDWRVTDRFGLHPEVAWAASPTDGPNGAHLTLFRAGVAVVVRWP